MHADLLVKFYYGEGGLPLWVHALLSEQMECYAYSQVNHQTPYLYHAMSRL